jgi:hypothetical protein
MKASADMSDITLAGRVSKEKLQPSFAAALRGSAPSYNRWFGGLTETPAREHSGVDDAGD